MWHVMESTNSDEHPPMVNINYPATAGKFCESPSADPQAWCCWAGRERLPATRLTAANSFFFDSFRDPNFDN
jgi:hypothetical protein